MTYGIGMKTDNGLLFMSDTRTNAGVDNISIFKKMFTWATDGQSVTTILAAGNLAGRVSRGRSATIAVEAMQFLRPVRVGDEVTIYAKLQSVGRTSMRIHVDSWARSRFDAGSNEVTNAEFVFVALDDDGKPRQINYHEDTAILS